MPFRMSWFIDSVTSKLPLCMITYLKALNKNGEIRIINASNHTNLYLMICSLLNTDISNKKQMHT
jgi:hypothetical protein